MSDETFLDNTYNDKIDGQYFTVNVIHRIYNNEYTNHIIGVKPYNYDYTSVNDKKIAEKYTDESIATTAAMADVKIENDALEWDQYYKENLANNE